MGRAGAGFTLLTPAHGRLRQEVKNKFRSSLGCRVRPRPAIVNETLSQKGKEKKEKKQLQEEKKKKNTQDSSLKSLDN